MTDLKKLRELAVAATPNWTDKQVRDEDGFSSQVGIISCGRGWTIFGTPVGGVAPQRNHDYLLAANPQVIIELLDRLERYEKALKEVISSDADYYMHAPGVNRLKNCVFVAREAISKIDKALEEK